MNDAITVCSLVNYLIMTITNRFLFFWALVQFLQASDFSSLMFCSLFSLTWLCLYGACVRGVVCCVLGFWVNDRAFRFLVQVLQDIILLLIGKGFNFYLIFVRKK